MHIAMLQQHKLAAVLLCAAAVAISCGTAAAASSSGDVETFSFPVFNATTIRDFLAVTNRPQDFGNGADLFERDPQSAATNRSEGFLLLPERIDVWRRSGAAATPAREASFNTTFTVTGSAPVAFVVINDAFPKLNTAAGFRGNATADNRTSTFAPGAGGGLADVVAGPVTSYGPEQPFVGLNVTVTPTGGAAAQSRTVWVEYRGAAHRLVVYVAAGGQAKPARADIDAELHLANGRTTETANVGFFAGAIRDVIDGVSGWELTADKLQDNNNNGGSMKTGTPWTVLLLAVLVSVAI